MRRRRSPTPCRAPVVSSCCRAWPSSVSAAPASTHCAAASRPLLGRRTDALDLVLDCLAPRAQREPLGVAARDEHLAAQRLDRRALHERLGDLAGSLARRVDDVSHTALALVQVGVAWADVELRAHDLTS